MADVVWSKTPGAGIKYFKAIIDATDNDTEILNVDPLSKISITIDTGSGETILLKWSVAQTPTISNMIGEIEITENLEDTFVGPITALQVTGATTNSSEINVVALR